LATRAAERVGRPAVVVFRAAIAPAAAVAEEAVVYAAAPIRRERVGQGRRYRAVRRVEGERDDDIRADARVAVRLAAVATTMAVGTLTATATVFIRGAAFAVLGAAETELRAVAGGSGFAAACASGVGSGGDGALDDVLGDADDGGQRGAHEEGKGC
jgi:hypothetical protein